MLNLSNGTRFETYIIAGERGSGTVALNGPAARLGQVGDQVIVVAYAVCDESEAAGVRPTVIRVDGRNRPLTG